VRRACIGLLLAALAASRLRSAPSDPRPAPADLTGVDALVGVYDAILNAYFD